VTRLGKATCPRPHSQSFSASAAKATFQGPPRRALPACRKDETWCKLDSEVPAGWCPPGTSNPVVPILSGWSVRFRHTSANFHWRGHTEIGAQRLRVMAALCRGALGAPAGGQSPPLPVPVPRLPDNRRARRCETGAKAFPRKIGFWRCPIASPNRFALRRKSSARRACSWAHLLRHNSTRAGSTSLPSTRGANGSRWILNDEC